MAWLIGLVVMFGPALVALEMLCWAGVLLGVGLAIAGVEAALPRQGDDACCARPSNRTGG